MMCISLILVITIFLSKNYDSSLSKLINVYINIYQQQNLLKQICFNLMTKKQSLASNSGKSETNEI
jgi:hypothetical protein